MLLWKFTHAWENVEWNHHGPENKEDGFGGVANEGISYKTLRKASMFMKDKNELQKKKKIGESNQISFSKQLQ